MKKASTLIGVILLIVIAVFIYTNFSKKKDSTPEVAKPVDNEVVCTQEAKLCPDGSYVGRSGPQCEFAKCPAVKQPPKGPIPQDDDGSTSTEPKLFKTVLGGSFFYGGITITPLQILEDSRCPVGTNCIWAGKVNVSIKIETNGTPKISQTSEISLTNSVVFQGKKISLLSMTPVPVSGKQTLPAEYKFEFSVANK